MISSDTSFSRGINETEMAKAEEISAIKNHLPLVISDRKMVIKTTFLSFEVKDAKSVK